MNKTDFIEAISKETGLSKADAEKAVAGFCVVIQRTLSEGDSVALVGFGTFDVSARAARTGRNPQTGAEIKIPASKAVRFKTGKGLKDAVNDKK